MQAVFIGIDVCQDMLDIAGCPGQQHLAIANRRSEIQHWLNGLPAGSFVGMESTGSYHQLLATLAKAAGFHVFVLNPKRVWYAARGDGRRSKTDRIDAQVIAKFLRDHVNDLHEWNPGTPLQSEIAMLERRRQCVERHCTAMTLSLKHMAGLDDQLAAFLASLKAMRQAIDQRIQALVSSDQELARKNALIATVPGIGSVGAASLAALFARVPFKRSDSVVAFIGLDVRASESGSHRGRRKLTKQGPPHLRRQVWLMGFAGCHAKIYKPIYAALKARGLKSTEAIMILGRRILRIAWAVWRTDKPFEPQLVGRQA